MTSRYAAGTLPLWSLLAVGAEETQATFSLLKPLGQYGSCCQTEFFKIMLHAMWRHPGWRADPLDADIVFFSMDTLRQCEWPEFRQRWDDKQERMRPGCVPGSTAVGEYEDPVSKKLPSSCGWCCQVGPDEFVAAVSEAQSSMSEKMFVMFANTDDTYADCGEWSHSMQMLLSMPVDIRQVGFSLQRSRLPRPADLAYPQQFQGINLLTPLHPEYAGKLPIDDYDREVGCNLSWRNIRASFSGQVDPEGLRNTIFELAGANGTESWHIFKTDGWVHQNPVVSYTEMLRRSVFAFVPRGDEHYSFRMTEVVAAGAIPVLIDDDFTPPLGDEDMKSWLVHIPENNVRSSIDIINSIPDEVVCSLRRNGSRMWRSAKDMDGLVDAMVEALSNSRGRVLLNKAASDVPATAHPPPLAWNAPVPLLLLGAAACSAASVLGAAMLCRRLDRVSRFDSLSMERDGAPETDKAEALTEPF